MPSQILHTMFGEDVISGLYNALEKETGGRFTSTVGAAREKIFCDYRGAFILGCQGPDIFYHSQRLKPVAVEYGSLLHRRGYGVFSANLLKMGLPDPLPKEEDIKNDRIENGINSHGAYALGFMTHAFLDRACHPYIIYRGANYHSFFERIIDALMLKELRGLVPSSWDQEITLAAVCEDPPPGLKESIAASFAAAFPQKVKNDRNLARRIDNAFTDSARFFQMTSPSGIKAAFSARSNAERPVFTRSSLNYVYPENLPEDIDFLNMNHRPWRYPHISSGSETPKDDNRSFPEIYSDAINSAVDTIAPIIKQYFESGVFPPAAAEKIGNQGLSILDENGKPCSPNLTELFPLEQVMEQQAKLRGVD